MGPKVLAKWKICIADTTSDFLHVAFWLVVHENLFLFTSCVLKLQDDSEVPIVMQHDDAEVVCDTGAGIVHGAEVRMDGSDTVMDEQQLIDETVWEMLQTFEENMQEQWLDSIMHELDA